jgi:hypothetical protein
MDYLTRPPYMVQAAPLCATCGATLEYVQLLLTICYFVRHSSDHENLDYLTFEAGQIIGQLI